MNIKKRIISAITSVAMLCSMVPAVFAADADTAEETAAVEYAADDYVTPDIADAQTAVTSETEDSGTYIDGYVDPFLDNTGATSTVEEEGGTVYEDVDTSHMLTLRK